MYLNAPIILIILNKGIKNKCSKTADNVWTSCKFRGLTFLRTPDAFK